jgi:acyl carrier protein
MTDSKTGMAMNKIQSGTEDTVRSILADLLGLSAQIVADMDAETELFGALPELDSMAVAGLLTEMEDRLGIMIDDDDVDGELFATFGNLVAFAKAKVAA